MGRTYTCGDRAHDPRLADFSPGFLVNGKIIETLIADNYNAMISCGDYPERSWHRGAQSVNHEFFCQRPIAESAPLSEIPARLARASAARYYAMLEVRWVAA